MHVLGKLKIPRHAGDNLFLLVKLEQISRVLIVMLFYAMSLAQFLAEASDVVRKAATVNARVHHHILHMSSPAQSVVDASLTSTRAYSPSASLVLLSDSSIPPIHAPRNRRYAIA